MARRGEVVAGVAHTRVLGERQPDEHLAAFLAALAQERNGNEVLEAVRPRRVRDPLIPEPRRLRARAPGSFGARLRDHAGTFPRLKPVETDRPAQVDEVTRKRLEHNEAVFRTVNEEIDEGSNGGTREYVCECADATCTETIRLSHDEYRTVRANPDTYLLIPGHEIPGLEDVVRREPDHFVVQKR